MGDRKQDFEIQETQARHHRCITVLETRYDEDCYDENGQFVFDGVLCQVAANELPLEAVQSTSNISMGSERKEPPELAAEQPNNQKLRRLRNEPENIKIPNKWRFAAADNAQ